MYSHTTITILYALNFKSTLSRVSAEWISPMLGDFAVAAIRVGTMGCIVAGFFDRRIISYICTNKMT